MDLCNIGKPYPVSLQQVKSCKYGHISGRTKSGNCKECERGRYKNNPHKQSQVKAASAKQRELIKSDPIRAAEHKEYMQKYAANNRQRLNELGNAHYARNNIKIRLRRKKIPITAELITYIEKHSGKCDLCGRDPDGRWKELHMDHCHTTNQFRGMLCGECNTGIGKFQDDPELLRKVARYVEHYR